MEKLTRLTNNVGSRGYEIMKVDLEREKVLVKMPDNEATPYVIWSFDLNGRTFWGHYYKELEKALEYYMIAVN